MNLTEFLDDTEIALSNGFGKAENIHKLYQALRKFSSWHNKNEFGECYWCDMDYPCYEVQLIEAIINES